MKTYILSLLVVLAFIAAHHEVMAHNRVSMVVRLGSVAFYLHSFLLPRTSVFNPVENDQSAEPCTLITFGDSFMGQPEISATLEDFKNKDDVWSAEFSHCIVAQTVNTNRDLSIGEMNALEEVGFRTVHTLCAANTETALPQGPYFVHYGKLYEAYRLYPDTARAFVVAAVPDDDQDRFRALDGTAYTEEHPSTLTVAVPSRLYYTSTKAKPYAGLRLGIKDIIDLKGLKTGASSRAYTDLYPVKNESADAVQKLIDLGFVVVGKLKTTQFADSEWPTRDWVDYHGPFNPRGDGYLTPSGSSAGSASAIASYDWLDVSLATDTLGSIRAPAAAQGIFGMRPSLSAVSTKGMVPYSPSWDTIGGFARTAAEYKTLAEALYGEPGSVSRSFKNPGKLLYPTDYWPVQDKASQVVFDKFVSHIESSLGINRTEINLADTWLRTRPKGTSGTLTEYFNHTFEWSANPDQWDDLLQPFIEDYKRERGKPPVLNPQIRFKVGYLHTVTTKQQNEGLRRLKIYSDWFYENIMPPAQDGYSQSVMVLPWTTGEPDYRDTYKDGPQEFTGSGFFFYNAGPYAQCPELVFPVGSTPYKSKYTGVIEQLPAAIGLIGAKGSDLMIADLVSKLFENSAPTLNSVETIAQQNPLPGGGEL